MASIWPLHNVVFDPDAVKVLAASYEQACRFAGNPSVPTKELFAKRILQAAKRGERDVEKLTECALVALAGGMADDAIVIADEQGGLTFVPMAEALPKRPV